MDANSLFHVSPFLCLDNSLVDEYVESDQDEDGSKLSGDEWVDAVEDGIVPGGKILLIIIVRTECEQEGGKFTK